MRNPETGDHPAGREGILRYQSGDVGLVVGQEQQESSWGLGGPVGRGQQEDALVGESPQVVAVLVRRLSRVVMSSV